jgi:hypothetical protein
MACCLPFIVLVLFSNTTCLQQIVQVEYLSERGLLGFDLMSVQNAVVLCPNCHVDLDTALDPGVVFFPEDLDYFIDFEKRDYEQRKRISRSRKTPSVEAYRDHQRETGRIAKEAAYGRYKVLVLSEGSLRLNFGRRSLAEINGKIDTVPHPWHGAPIAAIRRAIVVLGSFRMDVLSSDAKLKLRELHELYLGDNPVLASGHGDRPPSLKRRGEPPSQGDEPAPQPQSKRVTRAQTRRRGGGRESQSKPAKSAGPDRGQSGVNEDWVLGPQCSSLDAADRYSCLFKAGKS